MMVTTRSKKTKPSTSISVGETLVSEQEKRLAVRQARDATGSTPIAQLKREALAPVAERVGVNPDGAQSSPEMASLASSYMEHEDPNVRSLAATVLRLVRAD